MNGLAGNAIVQNAGGKISDIPFPLKVVAAFSVFLMGMLIGIMYGCEDTTEIIKECNDRILENNRFLFECESCIHSSKWNESEILELINNGSKRADDSD